VQPFIEERIIVLLLLLQNYSQISRCGCSPRLTRSRPTAFFQIAVPGNDHPPARFAAFAVICSEISAVVGFVPVSPGAIIQQH
jgi:hypothetical protein